MTSCDRRAILRGLGTAVTLPWLEAFRGSNLASCCIQCDPSPSSIRLHVYPERRPCS